MSQVSLSSAKIRINSNNTLGNVVNEAMQANPEFVVKLFDQTNSSTRLLNAQILDNFGRGITNLTTNTYSDTYASLTASTDDNDNI